MCLPELYLRSRNKVQGLASLKLFKMIQKHQGPLLVLEGGLWHMDYLSYSTGDATRRHFVLRLAQGKKKKLFCLIWTRRTFPARVAVLQPNSHHLTQICQEPFPPVLEDVITLKHPGSTCGGQQLLGWQQERQTAPTASTAPAALPRGSPVPAPTSANSISPAPGSVRQDAPSIARDPPNLRSETIFAVLRWNSNAVSLLQWHLSVQRIPKQHLMEANIHFYE